MDKKTPRALLKLDIGERRITVERRREGLPVDETPLFVLFSPYLRKRKQCLMVSLTGAVSSKIVTEERKGQLVPDGNRNVSANA